MSAIDRLFIEVANRPQYPDPHGQAARDSLGAVPGLTAVRLVRTFDVTRPATTPDGGTPDGGPLTDAVPAVETLFADPVVETLSAGGPLAFPEGPPSMIVWIRPKPGVTDHVGESAEAALHRRGFGGVHVVTGRKLLVYTGAAPSDVVDRDGLQRVVERELANPVVEEIIVQDVHAGESHDPPAPHGEQPPYRFHRVEVPLRAAEDDDALRRLDRDHQLSLTPLELGTIRDFYRELDRDPTDVELLTLAQTWSEHCKHKTLRSRVRMNGEVIDGLLQQTIFKATNDIAREDCLSVFVDNAGVIAFDDEYGIAFKVETHNHPSAIEPYGGAGTGIGGVIRDILGTGLGAKPILNTDVFCFAYPDMKAADLPPGTLHPATILEGVVAGVRDYGNRMGIPTPCGALYFDERYVGNPVVYAGSLGILPRNMVEKAARPGDLIVAVGGRTGRDGIGGATFSSVELTSESETLSATSVQIGNPIMEKRVMEGLLRARDEGLYTAVTDCGAGGFSSAVGEMGEETGATVELSEAPLKYAGLSAAEIWLSEAQERMVFSVPEENLERMEAIMALEGVEVAVLGKFTDDGQLRIHYEGNEVCNLPMSFLHDGLPQITREASWRPPQLPAPSIPADADWGEVLGALLAMPNIASKEWVIRQYDHEVQGGSAVKPLQGVKADGPGDAIVMMPLANSSRGVAVACGMNPHQGDLDPYHMAINAVDEALRNLAVVGVPPERAAILDNFSWGNPAKPEVLGSLVRAAQGCHDAAIAFRAPFVSGKDSLNNEFTHAGETITIPCTLLISAMGVLDDAATAVTMDLKDPESALYLAGLTRAELGASHLHLHFSRHLGRHQGREAKGGAVPQVDLDTAPAILQCAAAAVRAGHVLAAHDLSEGGLGVAMAEMAFAGGVGARIDLDRVIVSGEALETHALLFSESPTRLLFEVAPGSIEAFEAHWNACSLPVARIGSATREPRLVVHRGTTPVLDEPLDRLKAKWQTPLVPHDGPSSA